MGLESATYVSDLNAANPGATDDQQQGDDHIRLVKAALQATFPSAGKPFYLPNYAAKTANYTILSSEQNKLFGGNATSGAFQFTLPNLAASLVGWSCLVMKTDATAAAITVAPTSGTINGAASVNTTTQNAGYLCWWTGSTWLALTLTPSAASVSTLPWTSISLSAASSMTDVDKADIVPLYDTSATTNKKGTVEELFRSINTLTEETTVSTSTDFLVMIDTSASSAARKVKPSNVLVGSTVVAATQAELEAASSVAVFASPGRLKYHPGVPKVWACINGGATPSLLASFGVTSIADLGQGQVQVTFSTAFSSVNYCVQATIERSTTSVASNADREIVTVRSGSKTTTTVILEVCDGTDGGPVRVDPDSWNVVIYGDHA